MGWAMLPICTWTVLMGQVLTLGADMMNLLLSFFVLHFFSGSVQKVRRDCLCYRKDVLDLCPRYFDVILQVLLLKTQTKAASRARTGCGSNQ